MISRERKKLRKEPTREDSVSNFEWDVHNMQSDDPLTENWRKRLQESAIEQ